MMQMTIERASFELVKNMRLRNRNGRFVRITENDIKAYAGQKKDDLLRLVSVGVLRVRSVIGWYDELGAKFSESSEITLSDAIAALNFCGPTREISPSKTFAKEISSFREKFFNRFPSLKNDNSGESKS